MSRLLAGFGLVIVLIATGCDSKSPPTTSPAVRSVPPDKPRTPDLIATATTSSAASVALDIKSWDETLELVAQHKGKVVVLDLWSTSCEPCLVEFPHLVELHQRHGDKLVCMSA